MSGSQDSGGKAKAARLAMPTALPGGVLAAVEVGQVLKRVGRGADEGEVVLAGLDHAVGGGVGVELAVAEVDHDLAPGQPAAGVDAGRPRLDRVHRVLEQPGDERVVDVGDDADLDGGGGEPDVGARAPTRRAKPPAVAAADGRGGRRGGRRRGGAAADCYLKSCSPRPAGPRPPAPATTPAKRARLRDPSVRLPAAARLFAVRSHSVPSTTSLPVSFDPATPVRSRPK